MPFTADASPRAQFVILATQGQRDISSKEQVWNIGLSAALSSSVNTLKRDKQMNKTMQTNSFDTIDIAHLSLVTGGYVPTDPPAPAPAPAQHHAVAAAQEGAVQGMAVGLKAGRDVGNGIRKAGDEVVKRVATIGIAGVSFWHGLFGG